MVYNLGDMNSLDLLIERKERRKQGSSIHSVHSVYSNMYVYKPQATTNHKKRIK
jgi:hypothetical protein